MIQFSSVEQVLFEMLLFAIVGVGLEVVFTGLIDWRKDPKRHLWGYSSLWYLPIYMLAPLFFMATSWLLFPLPVIERGLIYLVIIFLCEYVSMYLLRKLLGSSPSEASYYCSRWNVQGLIRLDFAPVMFLLGLILETVYRHLQA